MRDVQQCAGQRRRHTRPDNQRREHAHDEHAKKMSAVQLSTGAGQFRLQSSGQLQLVKPEHRERQHDKYHRERAQHPGILQSRRQQRSRHAGSNPGQRISDRHTQHIGGRQQQAVHARHLMSAPDNDAGEDGHHGQDARRKRKEQAESEEAHDKQPGFAVEQLGDQRVLSQPAGSN